MDLKLIRKINELAKKSRETELSEEEKLLQDKLRRQYLDEIKQNLKNQLDNIEITDK